METSLWCLDSQRRVCLYSLQRALPAQFQQMCLHGPLAGVCHQPVSQTLWEHIISRKCPTNPLIPRSMVFSLIRTYILMTDCFRIVVCAVVKFSIAYLGVCEMRVTPVLVIFSICVCECMYECVYKCVYECVSVCLSVRVLYECV